MATQSTTYTLTLRKELNRKLTIPEVDNNFLYLAYAFAGSTSSITIPNGPQGVTGPQGMMGPQGYQGPVGPFNGPQGTQGPMGPQGFQGLQGAQGSVGPQGDTGENGNIIRTGSGIPNFLPTDKDGDLYIDITNNELYKFSGVPGMGSWAGQGSIEGDTGPQGPQGLQGTQGPRGFQGFQGFQGNVGPQGNQGPVGPQGLQGIKGDTGNTGATGPGFAVSGTMNYLPVFTSATAIGNSLIQQFPTTGTIMMGASGAPANIFMPSNSSIITKSVQLQSSDGGSGEYTSLIHKNLNNNHFWYESFRSSDSSLTTYYYNTAVFLPVLQLKTNGDVDVSGTMTAPTTKTSTIIMGTSSTISYSAGQSVNIFSSNYVQDAVLNVGGTVANGLYSMALGNVTNSIRFFITGQAGIFLNATQAGDGGVMVDTGKTFHVGAGSTSYLKVNSTVGVQVVGNFTADSNLLGVISVVNGTTLQHLAGGGTRMVTTNNSGTISAQAIPGSSFQTITGNTTLVAGTIYYVNNSTGTPITLTLPSSLNQNDQITIIGTAGTFTVAQNSGQSISSVQGTTTTGASGSLTSTNAYNCISLRAATGTKMIASVITGTYTFV